MAEEGSSTPSASLPLVWITIGKTQHAARLLEEEEASVADGSNLVRVRWLTTNQIEWVNHDQCQNQLTPRRRRLLEAALESPSPPRSPKRMRRVHNTAATDLKDNGSRRVTLDTPASPHHNYLLDDETKLASDRQSPLAATADAGVASIPAYALDEDDESDDSSIEVLLTIMPLTTQNKVAAATKKTTPPPEITMPTDISTNADAQIFDPSLKAPSPLSANPLPIAISKSDENRASPISLFPANDDDNGNAVAYQDAKPSPEEPSPPSSPRASPAFNTINKKPAAVEKPIQITTMEMQQPSTNNIIDCPTYSKVTSAYMQNLAEICHTIMEDRRWRVGRNRERLLAWELGDDLSAVLPLARRFRPTPPVVDQHYCPGVFCSCSSSPALPSVSPPGSAATETIEDKDSNVNSTAKDDDSRQQSSNTLIEAVVDTPEDRCLHLYCRMFYRKGPWFRMDDLFMRYYAPKRAIQPSPVNLSNGSFPEKGSHNNKKDERAPQVKTKNGDFFNRKTTAKASTADAPSTELINQEIFQRHLEAFKEFFEDLIRLKEMGLTRTFRNEEECGKTVGWSGVLLTIEERRQVLSKLGGGKKNGASTAARRFSGSNGGTTTGFARHEERLSAAAAAENEIWKQMCQQKSISAQFTRTKLDVGVPGATTDSNASSETLLPVSRHVNQVVLDKLATRVVQTCSPTEYVAAPAMKAHKKVVKDFIVTLLASYSPSGSSLDAALGMFGTCIRPREAPLKSVQRCCRLYLCATSGPGQMRSDGGANGWKSINEIDRRAVLSSTKIKNTPYASNVEPPGAHSWHKAVFPGMQHRFGLSSSCFLGAFTPLNHDSLSTPEENDTAVQIFYSREAFRCWEVCAEMRANVDYLVEINELVLYNERKQASEAGTKTKDEAGARDAGCEDDGEGGGSTHDEDEHDELGEIENSYSSKSSAMDFMNVLTKIGRKNFICSFLDIVNPPASSSRDIRRVQDEIERDVSCLFAAKNDLTECETILSTLAIAMKRLLEFRITFISESELCSTVSRPWLRHMSWEACTAYIMWDIIPILERRKFYLFAIQSLELLVKGSVTALEAPPGQRPKHICNFLTITGQAIDDKLTVAFAHFLLSRRARGKALDRMAIDLKHFLQHKSKIEVATTKAAAAKEIMRKGSKPGKKQSVEKKDEVSATTLIQDAVAEFTRDALSTFVLNAAVSFASIRTLARRLKQPLSLTLKTLPSQEAKELGLRLSSPELPEHAEKYSDWVPLTDHAVANSIAVGGVGGRCSFVGHEDDQQGFASKSLNVENLAMEFYGSGRLPPPPPPAGISKDESQDDFIKGGWVGWHDEGGLVRALFRVLSFQILGMDWGCQRKTKDFVSPSEQSTIHLTPYQGAPFDLHCGYELVDSLDANDNTTANGFYIRRQKQIQSFLSLLQGSSRQQMSDFVWKSIKARHAFMSSRPLMKDPNMEKDVLQCRTLSMLAAGFGGQSVAAMFRCYFFDYRFYSGGLPDLLLVRARFNSTTTLVDLGEWVGEAFDAKYIAELEAHQRASLLGDRDDDFLGCSKVGDSGAGRNSRSRSSSRIRPPPTTEQSGASKLPDLPQQLELRHMDAQVDVECMFVEVKSKNDRLDQRQEDWLNILSKFGNARVCQFSDGKEKGKKTKKKAAVSSDGKGKGKKSVNGSSVEKGKRTKRKKNENG